MTRHNPQPSAALGQVPEHEARDFGFSIENAARIRLRRARRHKLKEISAGPTSSSAAGSSASSFDRAAGKRMLAQLQEQAQEILQLRQQLDAALAHQAAEVPAAEVPAAEAPAAEVLAAELPAPELPAAELPAPEPMAAEGPAVELAAVELTAPELPAVELPAAKLRRRRGLLQYVCGAALCGVRWWGKTWGGMYAGRCCAACGGSAGASRPYGENMQARDVNAACNIRLLTPAGGAAQAGGA
ncbi:Serum response factor-binding protein 1 [Tetrabaena socialis]|uniref:Serum response factor-binding protein 1 n=1 Tax=Tetrabaena socialis TaxID=47790 RepID=A0A2J8A042_9CHLO|nr:Serum response factor-binding protein 1 [Tetrabaena socialis]|eukprot:PNH05884.1 Serum response factor-binding protein 1 [Tetrabaena socialis]